jgi:16S rRNA (adenine(1408)-N(1))-methyltransferase
LTAADVAVLSPGSRLPAPARLHLPFFRCSTAERTGEKDVECIRGKTSAEIDVDRLAADAAGYDDVLIDVGTGDGRYVLHVARTSPTWFAVGVDACRDNLREASRKAPPNALYVIANALALPMELGGMASKVTINFPWGSLLTALLDGEPMLLEGLLAVSRPGATLEVRLNAGALAEAGYTLESGGARIRQALYEGGFDVGDLVWLDARKLRQCPTTWAKRLAYGRDPRAVCLMAMLAGDLETSEETYMANGRYTGS